MEHLIFFAFLLTTSLLFALLEIQIEGKHGWAEKLPTWRIENRLTQIVYNKRPLTGYHLYLQIFLLVFVHMPFAMSLVQWSIEGEFRVLAFMILFWVTEDFLWFVCNPSFGIRRFKPEHIWWHRGAWWGIMPRDYWIWTPVAIAMYITSFSRLFR